MAAKGGGNRGNDPLGLRGALPPPEILPSPPGIMKRMTLSIFFLSNKDIVTPRDEKNHFHGGNNLFDRKMIDNVLLSYDMLNYHNRYT